MSDATSLLGLIRARANFYHSCSCTTADEEDWDTERALWNARSIALDELSKEISASLRFTPQQVVDGVESTSRRFWILSTEMGGAMTAMIFQNEADALAAQDRYMSDFRMNDEFSSHASCSVAATDLAPRQFKSNSEFDVRFALIGSNDGAIETSIHETFGAFTSALIQFCGEADYGSYESVAMIGCHEILIPQ